MVSSRIPAKFLPSGAWGLRPVLHWSLVQWALWYFQHQTYHFVSESFMWLLVKEFCYGNNRNHSIKHLPRKSTFAYAMFILHFKCLPWYRSKKKNKKHFFKKEKAQQFLQMVMNRHAGEGVPSTGCVIVFPRFTLKRGNILLTLLFHCHGVEKSKQHWKGYDCRWKQTEKSLNGTSIHLLSKDLWKSLTNTELHSPQTDS